MADNIVFLFPLDSVPEEQIKFAVIVTRFRGKWLFSRHKERTTWEIPGGHREPGESPIETARRELFEETGAVSAKIYPVGLYKRRDYGLLCYAEVEELDAIPAGSEIAETREFENLPEALTYDAIHAQLFTWVGEWLVRQSTTGLVP